MSMNIFIADEDFQDKESGYWLLKWASHVKEYNRRFRVFQFCSGWESGIGGLAVIREMAASCALWYAMEAQQNPTADFKGSDCYWPLVPSLPETPFYCPEEGLVGSIWYIAERATKEGCFYSSNAISHVAYFLAIALMAGALGPDGYQRFCERQKVFAQKANEGAYDVGLSLEKVQMELTKIESGKFVNETSFVVILWTKEEGGKNEWTL